NCRPYLLAAGLVYGRRHSRDAGSPVAARRDGLRPRRIGVVRRHRLLLRADSRGAFAVACGYGRAVGADRSRRIVAWPSRYRDGHRLGDGAAYRPRNTGGLLVVTRRRLTARRYTQPLMLIRRPTTPKLADFCTRAAATAELTTMVQIRRISTCPTPRRLRSAR